MIYKYYPGSVVSKFLFMCKPKGKKYFGRKILLSIPIWVFAVSKTR